MSASHGVVPKRRHPHHALHVGVHGILAVPTRLVLGKGRVEIGTPAQAALANEGLDFPGVALQNRCRAGA